MGRWEPDGRGRLEQAAMELFSERGFDGTTVSDIAERAGLTERTFFRHFADKREVLFGGAGSLQAFLVGQVEDAPESTTPMEAVTGALMEAAAVIFEERSTFARQRQAIVAANEELREREQIKLATLGAAVADALRRRGVPDLVATLSAEAGMTAFRVAFERWTEKPDGPSLSDEIRFCADELAAVTAVRAPARRR
jgi:AcrR family transcriptional regulator